MSLLYLRRFLSSVPRPGFGPRASGRYVPAATSHRFVHHHHQHQKRTLASVAGNAVGISEPLGPKILKSGIDLGAMAKQPDATRTILPNFWLRDNCRCTQCVNQDTMQRNFDTFSIPNNIRATEAVIDGDSLHVTWDHENHRSIYPLNFIRTYLYNNSSPKTPVIRKLWGAADVENDPPTVPFEEVMNQGSNAGMAKLTNMIQTHGFVFVSNTPVSPQETEKLLERVGPIRNTHYGGFYDFIPDLAMADTAYTNIALPAHTDTTYFTSPAGLQAFHLLSHHPPPSAAPSGSATAEGGKSLLVDGFKAARVLEKEDRKAFEILSTYRMPWHASGNKGIAIAPLVKFPVLEMSPRRRIFRVRWNNDDRGVLPFNDARSPRTAALMQKNGWNTQHDLDVAMSSKWYEAARKWNEILKRKDMEYWVQLKPGNTLIFDNWRVLHGRSAFEGVRRICGGYIPRDDFISRWRNSNFPREQVLSEVMG